MSQQGQAQPAPQGQAPAPGGNPAAARPNNMYRPEMMRNLPILNDEEKVKYERGLRSLWNAMESHAEDTSQHQDAKKKIQDFTKMLMGKLQARRMQLQQQQQQQQQQQGQQQGQQQSPQGQQAQPATQNKPAAQPQAPAAGAAASSAGQQNQQTPQQQQQQQQQQQTQATPNQGPMAQPAQQDKPQPQPGQNQTGTPSQGAAPLPKTGEAATAPKQGSATPKPAAAAPPPLQPAPPTQQQPQSAHSIPEHIMQHVRAMTFNPPPGIAEKGAEAATKWSNEMKSRYVRSLMQMEQSGATVKRFNAAVKDRQDKGNPFTPEELRQLQIRREHSQKVFQDAQTFVSQFRKSQEMGRNQDPNASTAGAPRPAPQPGATQQAAGTPQPGSQASPPPPGAGAPNAQPATANPGAAAANKGPQQAAQHAGAGGRATPVMPPQQPGQQAHMNQQTAHQQQQQQQQQQPQQAQAQQPPPQPPHQPQQAQSQQQPQQQTPQNQNHIQHQANSAQPGVPQAPQSMPQGQQPQALQQQQVSGNAGMGQPVPQQPAATPTQAAPRVQTPQSAHPAGGSQALSHSAAVSRANQRVNSQGPGAMLTQGAGGTPTSAGAQQPNGGIVGTTPQGVVPQPQQQQQQPQQQPQHPQQQQQNVQPSQTQTLQSKLPIPKQLPEKATNPPQPVNMSGPAGAGRPTYTGGNSTAGGVMGQAAMQKIQTYSHEAEGDHVLSKKKLDELVRQVCGTAGEGQEGNALSPEVEENVLGLADNFVDDLINAACRVAKERGAKQLEIRDIQLILERTYNIRVPGYSSDELRTVRKVQPAPGWITKMSAIQAAKVTSGKTE